MVKIVNVNPGKLKFDMGNGEMIEVDRPQSIPFNIIKNHNKIKAIGYSNNILACVFCDDGHNPNMFINYFKSVPLLMIMKMLNGDIESIDRFIDYAIDGYFPTYIEENPNYLI